MKKTIAALLIAIIFGLASITTYAQESLPTQQYWENGIFVTENGVVEPATADTQARDVVEERVGINANRTDYGPWRHGVVSGYLFSYYTNVKYAHGSSVQGQILVRSELVPAGVMSTVGTNKILPANNRAYWRVA